MSRKQFSNFFCGVIDYLVTIFHQAAIPGIISIQVFIR